MDHQGDCDSNKKPAICHRHYIPNHAEHGDGGLTPGQSFSIVSYNILAECHRQRWDYSYTPEQYLVQEYRHGLLMKELSYLNGDVVCLQEVSPDYFTNTLLPAMKSLGYDGMLMCRTKKDYDEGAATFFKTNVFEMKDSLGTSLTEIAFKDVEQRGLSSEISAAIKKYLDHADVILTIRLYCKASGRVVTVGNTHLWWDDNNHPDVKCVQVACAIQEVKRMAGSDEPYVICGDFNSDWSSPVYQLMLDGNLSDASIHTLQAVQRLELNGSMESLVDYYEAAIHHPALNLKSAYSVIMGMEPGLTCYTDQSYTLDYIFHDTKTLVPLGILSHVDQDVVIATGGLPSKEFPSDHLSLKTDLAFL